MRLWPGETLVLNSRLSPSQALQNLRAEVEPVSPWWVTSFEDHKYFEGEIVRFRFEITRYLGYPWASRLPGNKPLLPLINGEIDPSESDGGSTIHIRIRLHPDINIALMFWFAVVGLGGVLGLVGLLGLNWRDVAVMLLGGIAIGWLVAWFSYALDAPQQKQRLLKIFEVDAATL